MEGWELMALFHEEMRKSREVTAEALIRKLQENRQILTRIIVRLPFELPPSVDEDDLLQEISCAVVRAFNAQNPGRPFEQHLRFSIRDAIWKWLQPLSPLSRRQREQVKVLDKAWQSIEQRLHRHPSQEDLARETGWAVEVVRRILDSLPRRQVLPVAAFSGELDRPSQESDAFTQVWENDCLRRLPRALSRLSEAELQLLTLHYSDEASLREVGASMNMPKSSVSRVHQQALFRLRSMLTQRWGVSSMQGEAPGPPPEAYAMLMAMRNAYIESCKEFPGPMPRAPGGPRGP